MTIGRSLFRCVSRLPILGLLLSFLPGSGLVCGQTLSAAQPLPPAAADPAIAGALRQVSPGDVRATIEKLVSFNNRSTLSSMETNLPPAPASQPRPTGLSRNSRRYQQRAAAV